MKPTQIVKQLAKVFRGVRIRKPSESAFIYIYYKLISTSGINQ